MNNLIPYEPAKLINDMHTLMENLWQSTFDVDTVGKKSGQWLPAIDIKDEEDKFLISADLPGVDPKDINISLENNVLTLKGKREEVHEEKKGSFYRMERKQGQFYRQFTLPTAVDSKHIIAKSKQGVLEVTIPKKEKTESKKIEVKVQE
jgi:HSP20 family protein